MTKHWSSQGNPLENAINKALTGGASPSAADIFGAGCKITIRVVDPTEVTNLPGESSEHVMSWIRETPRMVIGDTIHEYDLRGELGISRPDLKRLIKLAVFDQAVNQAGSTIYTHRGFETITEDTICVTRSSYSTLKERTFDDKEICRRFDIEHVHSWLLLQELRRFDEGYNTRFNKIRPIKIRYYSNGKFGACYPAVQIKPLLKGVHKHKKNIACNGAYIIAADQKPAFPSGMTVDDVVVALGLQLTNLNRERVHEYFWEEYRMESKGRGKLLLGFNDQGKIASFLFDLYPKDSPERFVWHENLAQLYCNYYAKDPFLSIHNKILSNPAKRRARQDLPFFTGGIDLRTTPENVERFKGIAVSPLQVATDIFESDCADYFKSMGDDLDLHQVIKDESSAYKAMPEKSWILLEPFNIDGCHRYHEWDFRDFRYRLRCLGVLSHIRLGIRLKLALENYKPAEKDDQFMSETEVAHRLGLTVGKAKELGFIQDTGLLRHLSQESGIFYDNLDRFYQKYFKDRVPGFSDDAIRNWGMQRTRLEELVSPHLQEAPQDLLDQLGELQRQKSINPHSSFNLPCLPEHFVREDKQLYLAQAIEATQKIITADPDLKRRVLIGLKIKEFYDNPEQSGYVPVEKFKESYGIPSENWLLIMPHIKTTNPILEELRSERPIRENGKSLAIQDFDRVYFPETPNEFVRMSYAREFSGNFGTRETAQTYLKSIPVGLDVIIEEAQRLGIETSILNPIHVNGKNGEFYFLPGIQKWNEDHWKDTGQLQLAVAVRQKIDEARRTKLPADHYTLEDASSRLGVSVQILRGYGSEKHGRNQLSIIDVGVVPVLSTLISDSYDLHFKPSQIRAFCKTDGRYDDIAYKEGVSNLDAFEATLLSKEDAQKHVAGTGWLADAIFSYCIGKLNLVYFKGNKLHQSDVDTIRDYQEHRMKADVIRALIQNHLGAGSFPKAYWSEIPISNSLSGEQIQSISDKVREFEMHCYEKATADSVIGMEIGHDDLHKLVVGAVPEAVIFRGSKYHALDLNKLKNALGAAATTLGIQIPEVVSLSLGGYISLSKGGLTVNEKARLTQTSYHPQELIKMSGTVASAREIASKVITLDGNILYPHGLVQDFVLRNPVSDITSDGMVMLARSQSWHTYIAAESNGNGRELTEQKIVRYLLEDLNIRPKGSSYTGEDYARLQAYLKLIQDNEAHNLPKFKQNGRAIDLDRSYYTRTEMIKTFGVDAATLDKTCEQLGIKCLGREASSDHSSYNDMGLYSLSDTASILKHVGDGKLKLFDDPLEIALMHKYWKDKARLIPLLELRLSGSNIASVSEDALTQLGYSIKIGSGTRTGDIKDNTTYQIFSSAIKTLTQRLQ